MLELLSEELLCRVVELDGWRTSLIAAMAPLSRHMAHMTRAHLWPAYCIHRSGHAARELLKEGEVCKQRSGEDNAGAFRDRDGERGVRGESIEGKCRNQAAEAFESERESKTGGKEKETREKMEDVRDDNSANERRVARCEPPGGWISLAKILSCCPTEKYVHNPKAMGIPSQDDFSLSQNLLHCDHVTSLATGLENLVPEYSVEAFQTYCHEHSTHDNAFPFRGVIKNFKKSRARKRLLEILEAEKGPYAILANYDKNLDFVVDKTCPFCNARLWNASKLWDDIKTSGLFNMDACAFLCTHGHFYGKWKFQDDYDVCDDYDDVDFDEVDYEDDDDVECDDVDDEEVDEDEDDDCDDGMEDEEEDDDDDGDDDNDEG